MKAKTAAALGVTMAASAMIRFFLPPIPFLGVTFMMFMMPFLGIREVFITQLWEGFLFSAQGFAFLLIPFVALAYAFECTVICYVTFFFYSRTRMYKKYVNLIGGI